MTGSGSELGHIPPDSYLSDLSHSCFQVVTIVSQPQILQNLDLEVPKLSGRSIIVKSKVSTQI